MNTPWPVSQPSPLSGPTEDTDLKSETSCPPREPCRPCASKPPSPARSHRSMSPAFQKSPWEPWQPVNPPRGHAGPTSLPAGLCTGSQACGPASGHSLTPDSPPAPSVTVKLQRVCVFLEPLCQNKISQIQHNHAASRPQAVCLSLTDSDSSGRKAAERPLEQH